jgi:uncharacterized SAM-binding protein YcdF (DUF218 family)
VPEYIIVKSRLLFFSVLVALVLLYAGACSRAGVWLARNDKPVHADALVLLMGGIADRVLQVADLYGEGVASRVIIVTESMGAYRALEERGIRLISGTVQVRDALTRLGVPGDSIVILPGDACSTMNEAVAISRYLGSDQRIDTIVLVSSAYHMRRAGMIFETAFSRSGREVTVLCSPSDYTNYSARGWWKHKEEIQAVLPEYIKIGSFLFLERRRL